MEKEEYERRNRNAAARMAANKEIAQCLSEEQCDALEEICAIRHRIHVAGASELFNTESPEAELMEELEGQGIVASLKKLFSEASVIEDVRLWDIPDDSDWFEELVDKEDYDDYEDYRNQSLSYIADVLNRWNNQIEKFLGLIDAKYGTSYHPTGFQRLF